MSSLIARRFSLAVFHSFSKRNCLYIQRQQHQLKCSFSSSSCIFAQPQPQQQDHGLDLQQNKPGTIATTLSRSIEHAKTSKIFSPRRTWSNQDTEKLLKLVSKYGNKWKVFTSYFPGRTSFCIRSHYFSVTHGTTRWTLEEKKILQHRLRNQHDPDKIDWESIQTALLPKKRTVARIKQFWQNSIRPTLNRGSWTKEESQQLMDLVEKYGNKDWERISKSIGTRSEDQCRNKWAYEVTTMKKGEFSKEEDDALIAAVNRYGTEAFHKIKEEMKSKRSVSQLKTRYNNALDPSVDRSPWSEEEKNLAKELFVELKNIRAVKAKMNSKRSIRDMYNQLRNR